MSVAALVKESYGALYGLRNRSGKLNVYSIGIDFGYGQLEGQCLAVCKHRLGQLDRAFLVLFERELDRVKLDGTVRSVLLFLIDLGAEYGACEREDEFVVLEGSAYESLLRCHGYLRTLSLGMDVDP